jgi:hypothetical protein
MSFPTHLTDWKVGRLILLWPDKLVSTQAISRELDLGARTLRSYARRLGLGHRPIGTYTERKGAGSGVESGPWLDHPGTRT